MLLPHQILRDNRQLYWSVALACRGPSLAGSHLPSSWRYALGYDSMGQTAHAERRSFLKKSMQQQGSHHLLPVYQLADLSTHVLRTCHSYLLLHS